MRMRYLMQGAQPGMSRLAEALGNGNATEQQAYDAANLQQSRVAQALAAARQADAAAAEHNAKAGVITGRPAAAEELAALDAGTTIPMVRAIRQGLATGQTPQIELPGPATPEGGALMAEVPQDVRTKVGRALMRLVPLANSAGDIKADDWAKAQGAYRGMDLGDQVLAGQRSAADVGRAQAAVEAKPLYHADSTGAVLDLFGGGLATDNPMAGSTITLRKEQAGAQKANAAQSYAAAGASRALEAERRQALSDGVNRGGSKAPAGYRWTADGTTLEAIPGGPADPNTKGAKQAKPPTEGQSKALLFGSRMAVADDILGELADKGVNQPGRIKQAADAVPMVGGALGSLVNMAPSALGGPSGNQQLVEQAQRDFINAVLRRESGAAISQGEFSNAQKQYFPQPGDTPEVIRQKAANRRTAIAGFKAEVGEAWSPEFDRIVSDARTERKKPAPKRGAGGGSGGATGSWDAPPAAPAGAASVSNW